LGASEGRPLCVLAGGGVRARGRLVCAREGGYSTIQQGSGGRHQCLASCSRSHEAEPKLRHQNKLSGRVLGCLNPWIHACRNSAWMLLASGHGWRVCCTWQVLQQEAWRSDIFVPTQHLVLYGLLYKRYPLSRRERVPVECRAT